MARRQAARDLALAAGSALPLLLLIPWLWLHPRMPSEMLQGYGAGIKASFADRVTLYWDYFNPWSLLLLRRIGMDVGDAPGRRLPARVRGAAADQHLERVTARRAHDQATDARRIFFRADADRADTARSAGVRDRAGAARDSVRHADRSGPHRVADCAAVARAVVRGSARDQHPASVVPLARDYFGPYQQVSAFRYDAHDLGAVADADIRSDADAPLPHVYLGQDLTTGEAVQWLFHLVKRGREDLYRANAVFFRRRIRSARSRARQPPDRRRPQCRAARMLGANACSVVQVIMGAGGAPACAILRRN